MIKNVSFSLWSVKAAQDFLNYMEKRVGTEHTLKSIKSPSYFHTLRYASFRERVSLYEEYIGSVISFLQKTVTQEEVFFANEVLYS